MNNVPVFYSLNQQHFPHSPVFTLRTSCPNHGGEEDKWNMIYYLGKLSWSISLSQQSLNLYATYTNRGELLLNEYLPGARLTWRELLSTVA